MSTEDFFIFILQNENVEEVDFTQCLVHPVITNESVCDPVPFKPYNVKTKPPPNLDPARPDCGKATEENALIMKRFDLISSKSKVGT